MGRHTPVLDILTFPYLWCFARCCHMDVSVCFWTSPIARSALFLDVPSALFGSPWLCVVCPLAFASRARLERSSQTACDQLRRVDARCLLRVPRGERATMAEGFTFLDMFFSFVCFVFFFGGGGVSCLV